ncbi:MinD/ParA family ATP-binding protein [Saccharopolyspora sp. NPDC002376]
MSDESQGEELQAGAQSSAAELRRMGIDPAELGLNPTSSVPSAEPTQRIRPDEIQAGRNLQPPMPPGAKGGWMPLTPPPGTPAVRPPGTPPPGTPAVRPAALNRPLGTNTAQNGPAAALQAVANPEPTTLVPHGWRRLLRSVSFGLVTPGAAEIAERERRLLARIRARQQQPRVIAAVAGKGGVGTTTTSLLVSAALAALRHDPVVIADAQSGTHSLGRKLAQQPAPRSVQVLSAPSGNRPLPLVTPGGLRILDSARRQDRITGSELARFVGLLREHHAFTVLDVGAGAFEAADAALHNADQAVLVTTSTQDAVRSAHELLGRLEALGARRLLGSLLIVVVCLPGTDRRKVTAELRKRFAEQAKIVVVPFDRHLARGGQLDPTKVAPRTREAYLEIAAQLAAPR